MLAQAVWKITVLKAFAPALSALIFLPPQLIVNLISLLETTGCYPHWGLMELKK